MDHFEQLETPVAAATCDSLSTAATTEGIVPTIIGHRIDALEERLDTKLLARTTRHIILAFEGPASLEDCRRILSDLHNAEASVLAGGVKASGYLRVTASAGLDRRHIALIVPDFIEMHPDVSMTLDLGDRVVGLVDEDFDCVIRLGDLPDLGFVPIHLWESRRVMVAAPPYPECRDVPTQTEQFSTHNYLISGASANMQRGWASRRGGKVATVKAPSTMRCTNGAVLCEWRLQGYGPAWRSWWEVGHNIVMSKLVTVLDTFEAPPTSTHTVSSQCKHLPLRVRLFTDLLKNMYGDPAYWRRTDALIGVDQQPPWMGETPYTAYNQDKNTFLRLTSGGRMPQHILIPTDGSELSRKVVVNMPDFTKTLGARLTAYTYLEEYPYIPFSEIVAETPQVFKGRIEAQAHVMLKGVEDATVSAGTRCGIDMSCFAISYMGIIGTVECHGCSVIFMAPHGWHGLAGLLLDSETQKVLTCTKTPVIIYY